MRRTQLYRVMPWVGGVNTSVDPGVLNSQELVKADNVQFSSTGARIKREAFEYLDLAIGAPDFRSSSGTTRTLKWTTSVIVGTATPDERLVVGEKITVTGNANYNVTAGTILTRTGIAEVTSIVCTADVSGSLAGKYFLVSAGDSGIDYYVWYKVSGTGTDPSVSGRQGIEVDISTNASAASVATATATALDALAAFISTPSTATVTCTAASTGYAKDATAGTSGFAVTIPTQGGTSITYTASSALSESSTAAGVTVTRASQVIFVKDYWRYTTSGNTQLKVFATNDFQLFRLDEGGHRIQILGQGQTTTVDTTGTVTSPTTIAEVSSISCRADVAGNLAGKYFLLSAGNGGTNFYVWYTVNSAGADPAVVGRTGIVINVATNATATAVAIATTSVLDARAEFIALRFTSGVQITAATAGPTTHGGVGTSGFSQFSVDTPGGHSVAQGSYFLLSGPNNTTNYYVWYTASGSGDPLIPTRTGIRVTLSAIPPTSATYPADIATATAAAIDALADFSATAVGNVVTIVASAGLTTDAADVTTGYTVTRTVSGATAPVTAVSTIRGVVFNERLQIYFSGLGNYPIIYNPDDNAKYTLMGTLDSTGNLSMPDASFAFVHLGRVWANDKTNSDYLHYSETFDETKWLGIGDSGAQPINPGDGDPLGITNAYVYKGFVVAAKKDARYRVLGDSPENFSVETISAGMGNEGSLAIPVDESDVMFVSKRGIHSQQTTDQYGDTDAAYLSADIKPTFNTWDSSSLKLMQGAYIPELNSVAISVTEQGKQSPNAVWLYNIGVQVPNKPRPGAWYRWPDVSCTALARIFTSDKHKLVFGTSTGRLIQAQHEDNYADFGTDGIPYTVKSGTIYPGDDPQMMKRFTRISMIYRPQGSFNFSVQAKIDNQQSQAFAFTQVAGLDTLGVSFILGTSELGSSSTLAPFTFSMEGYGRGVTLTITQPTADQQIEIWGFIFEYENADLEQEVE